MMFVKDGIAYVSRSELADAFVEGTIERKMLNKFIAQGKVVGIDD